MQKKDKEKVLDEVWTLDRVRGFLDLQAPEGFNSDFNKLLKAYQSMREENFEQFVGFFKDAGGDLNALSPEGHSVLSIVKQHAQGAPYAAMLSAAGAA
jgi:hypothetical protein